MKYEQLSFWEQKTPKFKSETQKIAEMKIEIQNLKKENDDLRYKLAQERLFKNK